MALPAPPPPSPQVMHANPVERLKMETRVKAIQERRAVEQEALRKAVEEKDRLFIEKVVGGCSVAVAGVGKGSGT